MKHIKKYKMFKESTIMDVPVKPEEPQKPTSLVTEMDVVNEFIKELNKSGESVKKYLK